MGGLFMSYGTQSPRRSTGRGRGKVHHKKSTRKEQRHSHKGKYLLRESEPPQYEEIVDKTLARLRSLGNQVFAVSPFSEYYDDWLLSLKTVLSEFESSPEVKLDSAFIKKRSEALADVERKLAKRRQEENLIEKDARRLARQNHRLVQIDRDYASATHELSSKRNSDIKRLTGTIHDYEEELEEINRTKSKTFSPFARRAKSKRATALTRKLESAKSELEGVLKKFEVEQEKLHDEYEKNKTEVIEQVRSLEKKIKDLDSDNSAEDRRVACETIINAVEDLH
jgi:DNA repair exonuclease SbcCD ATPase subunit